MIYAPSSNPYTIGSIFRQYQDLLFSMTARWNRDNPTNRIDGKALFYSLNGHYPGLK